MKKIAMSLIWAALLLGQQQQKYNPLTDQWNLVSTASSGTAAITAAFNTATSTCTSSTGSCTASPTSGAGGLPGLVLTHNLGLPYFWIVCMDAFGNQIGSSTSSTGVTAAVATTNNIATITFSAATSGTCAISSGAMGPPGATGSTGPAGAAGSTGAAGAGYAATSATSLVTAGSGSKSFTTQAGLAYSIGARIRATSTGTAEYMEGVVTSYSGTTLVATMDTNSGTGTHADWSINLAGNVGLTGPTGNTGNTGATGAAGTGNNGYCLDTSVSTTTYVCTAVPVVTTLSGLTITFVPATTNTGTSTVNPSGLGAKTLKQADGTTNVASGALVGGTGYLFAYDGTNFRQVSSNGGGLADPGSNGIVNRTGLNVTAPATAHSVALLRTCATSSASGSAETCNTSPTFTPVSGDAILFQADVANTGAFTLNVNSLGAKSVKKNGTAALVANDILASPFQATLVYDGTNWQMQSLTGNAGSTGTVNSGTAGQLAYYATSTAAVSTYSAAPKPCVPDLTGNTMCITENFTCQGAGMGAATNTTFGCNNWAVTAGGGLFAGAYFNGSWPYPGGYQLGETATAGANGVSMALVWNTAWSPLTTWTTTSASWDSYHIFSLNQTANTTFTSGFAPDPNNATATSAAGLSFVGGTDANFQYYCSNSKVDSGVALDTSKHTFHMYLKQSGVIGFTIITGGTPSTEKTTCAAGGLSGGNCDLTCTFTATTVGPRIGISNQGTTNAVSVKNYFWSFGATGMAR